MNPIEIAEKLIKKHEGFRPHPYQCTTGKLTIGYGRNLEAEGIRQNEAAYLLSNDLADCWLDLSSLQWFSSLDPVRQAAVIDMRYNLGSFGLRKFRRMIAALEMGDFELAAKEALDSTWSRQVKDRAKRLAEMIRTGEMPEL